MLCEKLKIILERLFAFAASEDSIISLPVFLISKKVCFFLVDILFCVLICNIVPMKLNLIEIAQFAGNTVKMRWFSNSLMATFSGFRSVGRVCKFLTE